MRPVVQIVVLSSIFSALPALADTSTESPVPVLQGWYEQGKVNDYFGNRIQSTQNQGFILELPKSGPQVAERKKQTPQQTPQSDTFKENPVPKEEQLETKAAVPQTPEEKRADIISKFGNPLEAASVRTQDSAPTPFKGMMAALDAGDDELAAQYARQLVRYKRRVNGLIGRQVAIERKMMQREDMIDISPDDHPEENWVLDLKFPDEEAAKLDNGNSYLDEEARKLIEKEIKRAGNNDLFNNRQGKISLSDGLDEKTERARARQILKGRVPSAPGGFVDIYFYLRTSDKEAKIVASEIEKLYQEVKKSNNKVNLVALTLDSYDSSRVNNFKSEARVTYSILPGADIARAQGVVKSPTVVFTATRTGRVFTEEGPRNFYFYSEILNLMKGSVK